MNKDRWFSVKLRFAIMVEPIGASTMNDCLFLLKANDFDSAFKKAIKIGVGAQKDYLNALGQKVQWKFSEIISLDVINSDNLDGAEIYSEPLHLEGQAIIPLDANFSPEASRPIQTL
ncbi:DUF4288 domain-containing protein [Nitrospirillum sp. BR 11163]|uniref:DUF4288 domain-containing protein n=1 Tax=Nitrospirillum sp. BR 11163 TaxID=3104323 RepID=UPI002AFEB57D|nr:DUF4288 domain-containing protein [Nitrospirillum sp. BR 11163]MEA1675400.1 DUF4288 domain-containing protein [Nitrospirillum sp. BR 11163]